ncbi:DUF2341 domain-containing protein [Methanolobus sp. ZRKC3]|uniref:DUF2341 domain-containing protein n=1 Tax=Methanolobus sp. ZRKC3 TaxID=3125786 RepID=UPI003245BE74
MRVKIVHSGIILLLIIFGFANTCSALSYSGGGEWSYSDDITIMENSGQKLVDYQVLILLNSSNFDFNKAQDSGRDIRFESGEKQLKYWIEEWDSQNGEARIWVKVPSIAASGSTKIKMYYGNPLATGDVSGASTFLFFDDFSGSSVGFGNWDSFYTGGGEIKVSNGVVRLIVPKFHPEDVSSIKSEDAYPVNSMFVVSRKKVTTGTDSRGPIIEQGFVDPQKQTKNMVLVHTELEEEAKVTWIFKNQKSDARYFPKDLTSLNEPEDNWYTTGVAWYMEDELGKVAFFKNGIRDGKMDLAATEEMNYIPVSDMKVYLFASTFSDNSDNTGYAAFDYAYVRKFVSEEPTVVFGERTEADVSEETPAPVKINITPSGDRLSSIRIFDTEIDDDSAIADLKNSGINTVMLRVDEGNIWSLESFVKTAHENDMQVYAMVFNDPEEAFTEDTSKLKSNIATILDYNNKSLAGFDGILLSLNPCSDDPLESCEENLLLLADIREMTSGGLAISVDVPADYDRSFLGDISDDVDLFILLTYDTEGERLITTNDIVDSIASKMGEIRAADGKAVIEIAVNDDFMTSADVQNLLEELQDYYSEDGAYIGTSLVVYDEYLQYSDTPAETEEDRSTPAFTGILATLGLLGAVLVLKKR